MVCVTTCVVFLLALAGIINQGEQCGISGEIKISSFPTPAYFVESGTMSIICGHTTELIFRYMMHPRDGIISVSTGRYVVDSDSDVEATLTVRNARQSDEGPYQCVFFSGALCVSSPLLNATFGRLIVITPPDQAGNITVAAGDSFNFTCTGEFVLQRQWAFLPPSSQAVALVNSSDGRVKVTRDFEVVFRGILPQHQGSYTCHLSNEIERTTIVVHVKVVVRPVTSVTPDVFVVEEGAMATISCHARGTPLPSVTWRDTNDEEITPARAGVTIQESVADNSLNSSLTIASVSGAEAGQYRCRAENSHGVNSSTGYIRLRGTPEPPLNVMLEVANQTNILVTWDPPNSEVVDYVVTWEAITGSSALDPPQSQQGVETTSYLVSDLQRLTTYSVTVHAVNSHGVGMLSAAVATTTTATVPGAPLGVAIPDVGPFSVRVEWSPASLPTDNGGSPLRTVRLTYRRVEEEGAWSDGNAVLESVESMSAVVSGLRDGSMYIIRMEVGNDVGFGPGAVSEAFLTPPPGFPGTPSRVVGMNLTGSSALVCWRESDFGTPFTSYAVEIRQAGTTEGAKILRMNASGVGMLSQSCSTGVKVPDLLPGTCYTFAVSVSNSQGTGLPSPASEEYCTASCGNGVVCREGSGSAVLSTGAIAGVAVGSVVLLAVVLAFTACLALRKYKKSSLRNSMTTKHYYTNDTTSSSYDTNSNDSRRESAQSARSTAQLLVYGGGPRTPSYNSSSCDSLRVSPDTSTTMVSNPDQNPFDFTKQGAPVGSAHGIVHSQPVLLPHQPPGTNVEYPQGMGTNVEYAQGTGSVTDKYPMYPILEDPPPYPHHMFPNLVQSAPHLLGLQQKRPPQQFSRPVMVPRSMSGDAVSVMTDNPNYEEQEHQPAVSHSSDSGLYQADHMSEVAESDASITPLQIPTPHFGESYSQSGYSPVLQRRQGGGGKVGGPVSGGANTKGGAPSHVTTQKSSNSDEGFDDDTEFVDNDAYVTFTTPSKFKIVSEERGSVFETVKVK